MPASREPSARALRRAARSVPAVEGRRRCTGAQVAYECWGELNADRSNAILLFTGLSPSVACPLDAGEPGGRLVGKDDRPRPRARHEPLLRHVRELARQLLRLDGSRPRSNPATGKPYRLDFPELSVEDIARAGYEAARSLGIEKLDTVMGPSLGGMVVRRLRGGGPGRRAPPRQHLRFLGRAAVRDRAALAAARGDHQRPGLAGRQLRRQLARAAGRHAHRAQARHDHLPFGRRMARCASAATACRHRPQGGDAGDEARSPPASARASTSRAISRRRPSASCASSTRTATCTCRARWTASTSPRMAIRWRCCSAPASNPRWSSACESDLLFTIREQEEIATHARGGRRAARSSRACRASRATTRSSSTCRGSTRRSAAS